MAITPRSKGLGNIGAIVDREGRASVAAPKAPVKPVVKAAPKPAPKPVAKVAPKPAPKLAPKPNPFAMTPEQRRGQNDTRAPGGGGMDINGNPIGGGMGAQFNIAAPNFARNTGPMNGAAPAPGDLYNRGGPFTPRPDLGPGVGFGVGLPQTYEFQTAPDFGNYDNLPPPPGMGGNPYEPMPQPGDGMYPNAPPPGYDFGNPGYGGPFTPRPDLGPGVGFGVGLPQPGMGGQQPAFIGQGGTPEQWNQFNQGSGGGIGMSYTNPYGPGMDPSGNPLFGEPAPYNGGMMSPSRVINQVGKPGFQPRPNMSNAFNPNETSDYDQLEGPGYNTGGFMGGSGSMFGGGGFGGR